mgnify:CR=1 FL=1
MGTAMMKSTMVIAAEIQQAQHRTLGIELVRTKRTQNAQVHILLTADTVLFTVFSPV